jgi:hypothetical protein
MKTYWRVVLYVHIFLTSALAGGKWLVSRPGRFTPAQRAPGTHWIGGWVCPRAGLDDMTKKKILPHQDSNSKRSVVQPVVSRYSHCGRGGGVQTGSTRHVVPAPGDCEDGEFGGMKIDRGNQSTRRKPAPAPLFPPQIPLDHTWARTRAAAVGSQRLTAWSMARPVSRYTDYAIPAPKYSLQAEIICFCSKEK